MKKKIHLLLLTVLCAAFARAEVEYVIPSDGVFHIINMEYGAAMMENFISHTVNCTAVGSTDMSGETTGGAAIGGDEDYEQMWVLKKSGSGYSIQNVFTGEYIQTGNDVNNVAYWTGKTECVFNIVENKDWDEVCYNIWDPSLGSKGLHCNDASNVVRWGAEPGKKAASEWRFVKANVTEEQIAAARAEYTALSNAQVNRDDYQAILNEVFVDSACTILSSTYTAMDAEGIRAALADKLPEALVNMAVKAKTDEWAEPNEKADKPGWDSDYAKKFRVQLIEPYSIAGEITSWFGHNAHTNMDNPTGIYANKRGILYVMVEGEVKEGAELWACWITGHSKMPNYNGGYSNGVRLQSGLNIIPFGSDGSALYINYLVHTYNTATGEFTNKLSNYDDLKVHIEGGYINGYYNAHGDALYEADNDSTWKYYEERANLRNITIVGAHQILQFELNDVEITETNEETGVTRTWTETGLATYFPEALPASLPANQRINAIVEAWDRIMLSEKITLGEVSKSVVDSMNLLYPRWDAAWENKAEMYDYEGYAEFCDGRDYGEYYNHHGLAFGTVTGYMYGSWDHCGYHINTTHSILTQIATEAGPAWGPGHEIGHQHQGLFTVNGLTEVTNNLFSNIAVWYMGFGTSRVNGNEGSLPKVYDNFKAGNDFFGNNIWALTQMYYRLWLYYHRAGNNTQFYPRLFELLRQQPMTKGYDQMGKNTILRFYQHCCDAAQEDLTEFFRAYGFFRVMDKRHVGDYANSEYTQSQKDIDAAIASVKAKGYPVNNLPLFINDCTPEKTYGHDGKTVRSFWDGGSTTNGTNAEIGCYVDYLAKDGITGQYLYNLDNLKFNISIEGGDGAVGFAVYNKKGEIQAFSNHHKFYLNKDVASMIRAGEYTVVAVSPDGKDAIIQNSALRGTAEEQLAVLKKALETAKAYLEKTGTTGTQIGYLIPDSAVVTEYNELVTRVQEVITNADTTEYKYGEWYIILDAATVEILTNTTIRVPLIPNCYYSLAVSGNGRYMDNANAGLKTSIAEEGVAPQQWKLIPADEQDTYYIQQRETGNYITTVANNQRVKATSNDRTMAVAFRLVPDAPGEFYIQRADNANINLYNYKTNNQVYAAKNTTADAKWLITLEDDMMSLPETSTDEELVIYGLLRADSEKYAGYTDSRTGKGRLYNSAYNERKETNFWFYFIEGSEEGKYAVYNYATRMPVTANGSNLWTNKEAETAPEYVIARNAEGTGLVISAPEGCWHMDPINNLGVLSTTDTTLWKLQLLRTISLIDEPLTSLTIDKATATLTEGETLTLTVATAPSYATDHSVTWSSSDEAVATVDANGKVDAIAAGTATITATANDKSGLTATCQVTVKKKVEDGIDNATGTALTVQSKAGVITLSGLAKSTTVSVYDITGRTVATSTATDGTATIDTRLTEGSTVIVRAGDKCMKVSL